MAIAGVGIIISIIGTLLVKISSNDAKEARVQKALNIGNWASINGCCCMFWLSNLDVTRNNANGILWRRSSRNFFNESILCLLVGLVVGAGISSFTEYYTGLGKKPILKIVQQSSTGAGTNIIAGLATG